jgi:hypothetical protein
MAMDIWAAAGADITTDGAEAAVIITDGTEDAAITSIAGKPSLYSLSSPHCLDESESQ